MRIFINFFLKTTAFFLAISVFFVIIALLIGFFSDFDKNFSTIEGNSSSNNKIALLKLNGPILNNETLATNHTFLLNFRVIYTAEVEKILKKLELENIKGLIVSINSPGGSVGASYKLFNIFKNFKEKNDVEIFFHTNELMTSGAYWVALSGKKIFAEYGSLIGSIGVKGPDWIYYDEPTSFSSGILGNSIETKKGIKKFGNIAGNSKDLFDPFRPPTKEESSKLQKIVQNIYNDFIINVSKNRKLEKTTITKNIGAMIFDTKSAKENFLIDDIGELQFVTDSLVKYLNFKDYQIIEIQNKTPNFLQELIKSSFYSENYIENINKSHMTELCNIIKFQFSVIIIQNNLISSC